MSENTDCLIRRRNRNSKYSATKRKFESNRQEVCEVSHSNGMADCFENSFKKAGHGKQPVDNVSESLDDSDICLGEVNLSLVTEENHRPCSSPHNENVDLCSDTDSKRKVSNFHGHCPSYHTPLSCSSPSRNEHNNSFSRTNDTGGDFLSDSVDIDLFDDMLADETSGMGHNDIISTCLNGKADKTQFAWSSREQCDNKAETEVLKLAPSSCHTTIPPHAPFYDSVQPLCKNSDNNATVTTSLQHCGPVRSSEQLELLLENSTVANSIQNGPALNQSLQVSGVCASTSREVNGTRLKNRLKLRLLQNTTRSSASTGITVPSRIDIEDIRNKTIARAKLEASQIRREGVADGIGPFYGLPSKVQEMLSANRKISKLYAWQDKCLQLPAVFRGGNLIYTLPTSGGKTLVAEILILRQLLCKKKDALLILPYISIVQEKVRILSEFATELGFLVEEYAGSKGRFPPTKRREKKSLFVATIEKAHSLANSLVEAGRLAELGLVVVDELHMIGEGGSRGAAMESTLLKLLHAAKEPPQVIGMSATLSNINDLAQFLNAEVFYSDFRPVSLTEYVKVDDSLYQVDPSAKAPEDKLQYDKTLTFQRSPEGAQMDPDNLLDLVLEIVPDHSCLLFCPTKRHCENVTLLLATLMGKNNRYLSSLHKDRRRALLQELLTDGGGKLCPTLRKTVPFGLAYHHSGLTTDERRLIEEAYSDGVLCVLACTSTLAAGVNLPAKRVILRSPYVGAEFIKHSQYKQMTGRAGRAGIDCSGESILISKKSDLHKVLELLSGPQDVCHSSLMHQSGEGLKTLILSLIALKLAETTQAVFTTMQKTLLSVQASQLGLDILAAIRTALQELLDQGLVIQTLVQDLAPSHLKQLQQQHSPPDLLSVAENYQHDAATSAVLNHSQTAAFPDMWGSHNCFASQNSLSSGSEDCFILCSGESQESQLLLESSQNSDVITSRNVLASQGMEVHLRGNTRLGNCTRQYKSQDFFGDTNALQDLKATRLADLAESGVGSAVSECFKGAAVNGAEHSITRVQPCLEDLKLQVTELGRATFKGSVDLQLGPRLYRDLKQGEQSLVVANHLHLLYLVTPYDLAKDVTPNWNIYLHQLGTLAADELKVATLVDVTEGYIARRASGQTSRQKVDLAVVKRFYLTLMLHELWKQFSVWDVSERFQQPRGFVQNLLTSASSFASCVLRFAQELPEFWAYQDLLGNFSKRLTYCVSIELIPLMEVTGIKLGQARQLYDAGFDSLQSLAAAEPAQLVSKVQFLTHKAARQIISATKIMLEEKTSALLEQVELLVPVPPQ